MQELVSKRTAHSKTFDLGGGKRRLVCGGAIAHHLKDGAWVDTICDWQGSSTEFLSSEYPYVVKVNKGTCAITTLAPPSVVPITVAPVNRNKKAVAAYAGNIITIPGLWAGVDCYIVLTPERPVIEFERTAAVFVNPAFSMAGSDPTPMLSAYYEGDPFPVPVPATEQDGTVTYDLSAVPIGKRVR